MINNNKDKVHSHQGFYQSDIIQFELGSPRATGKQNHFLLPILGFNLMLTSSVLLPLSET